MYPTFIESALQIMREPAALNSQLTDTHQGNTQKTAPGWRSSAKLELAFFIILGAIGTGIVLAATSKHGARVIWDSVSYISTAESLRAGRGFTMYGGTLPYQQWPPLVPIVLALSGWGWMTPEQAGRYVDAFSYGLSVFLCGVIAVRCIGKPLAYLAPICALVGLPIIYQSSHVLSEPLFLAVSLGLIFALVEYLRQPRRWLLWASGILAALGWLTRYIGVVGIVTGAVVLLVRPGQPLRKKVRESIIFTAIGVVPFIPWYLRGKFFISEEMRVAHSIHITPVTRHVQDTVRELSRWLMPSSSSEDFSRTMLFGAVLLLTGVALGLLLLRAERVKTPPAQSGQLTQWRDLFAGHYVLAPVLIFSISYVAFLIVSETLTQINPIDGRLLSGLYIPLLIVVIALLDIISRSTKRLINTYAGVGALGISIIIIFVWVGFSAREVRQYVRAASGGGLGGFEQARTYAKSSPFLNYLKSNASQLDRPVFTGEPQLFYYHSGVKAYQGDWIINPERHKLPTDRSYLARMEGGTIPGPYNSLPLQPLIADPGGALFVYERYQLPPAGQAATVLFRSHAGVSTFGSMNSAQPAISYQDSFLRVGRFKENLWRGALRINISSVPQNAKVVSAKLVFRLLEASSSSPVNVVVTPIASPWHETPATWSAQPPHNLAEAQTMVVSNGEAFVVDISAFVRKWVADPASNNGVLLRLSDSDEHLDGTFKSFGSPATPFGATPELIIMFTQ